MVGVTELAKPVAKKAGVSQKTAKKLINEFLNVVVEEVKNGNKVRIKGLGIFEKRVQKPRNVRNPRTGKIIKVPQKHKFAFRPSGKVKYL